MPLRFGIFFCTSAILALLRTKSSGTISPKLKMNATNAYVSSGVKDLGAFQGIAR